MQVHTNISGLPHFNNAVITIGTFDGVHLGHKIVLRQLVEEATNVSGTPIVITFFPHPRQVVDSGTPMNLLTTYEEKYKMLHDNGVEHIVVIPFDKTFSKQTASEYISDFLVKNFKPHTIITGYDHRFGANREGDYHLLESEGAKFGFAVKEIPEHVTRNVIISSTRIREALLSGDVELANDLLGYNYAIKGTIIEGNKLGRTIGFPTANLDTGTEGKLIPANGVYAVKVDLEGNFYKGMMNIGIRPTVGGTTRVVEVNIFDFSDEVYGKTLKVSLVARLRDEKKFNGLDALKNQLTADRQNATAVLKD